MSDLEASIIEIIVAAPGILFAIVIMLLIAKIAMEASRNDDQ